ncbi:MULTISPECIES: DUF6541 family protein [Micromonospora]|uniref:4-amino-4-deoxy-L-arabinose transferase n=1 Tax=Micromonospora yangpuensis TaxID=683228 RepID=A0A1C6UFX2_9ACTN|nr:DUF6541 family protein [Micromonospora yangpuensis]GGM05349.1 hypothetical protein GCM10012279_23810 [Micromonospora yangpuensis]SCL52926.1 hypothetical protein GA0070617_2215 [Micromonospora yangpuensis]
MTVVIALLVAVVPGALLGFVLPPGRYRWVAWAAAPTLTLGLIALAMAWLPLLGLPDSAGAVLIAELVLAGAVVAAARWFGRGRPLAPACWFGRGRPFAPACWFGRGRPSALARWFGRGRPSASAEVPGGRSRRWLPTVRPSWADLLGVAVPATVAVGYGWLILGRLVAPPGWDLMNHGYLTRRILDSGSTVIGEVCSSGSTETIASCGFYPLAGNVAWAQATQLSGGRLSTVMATWAIVVAPVALVAGIYACVRVLGGRPAVAAAAATAPVFLGPLWTSMLTGRLNEQAAPCLAGGAALLIGLALRGHHPVRTGLLGGLAGAGILLTHSYDVLFVGVLALGVAWALGRDRSWRRTGVGVGALVVGGLVPIVPLLGAIFGAGGERRSEPPSLLGRWGEAVGFWVTDPQRYVLLGYPAPGGADFQLGVPSIQVALGITVACLLAAPLALVLRPLRWARPWLLAGVVFTLVGIATVSSDAGVVQAVAGLWYGIRERPRTMIFPVYGVATVAGAVVLGTGLRWLLDRLARRATPTREGARDGGRPAAFTAVAVVAGLAVLAALPATWRPLRAEVERQAPVGPSYRAAFAWVAERVPPGGVVAYERHLHFMSWLHADYGVPTLFGIPPLSPSDPTDYPARFAAWDWLAEVPDAAADGCTVRRFGIEYVMVGDRQVPGWAARYRPERLPASERVRLVHQVGGIQVYQVTEAGRACPTG